MANHQFQGTIIDKNAASLGNLRVDALDARKRVPRPVASAPVSSEGEFMIQVSDESLARYFGDAAPELFFRISMPDGVNRACLASTERKLTWTGQSEGKGSIQVDTTRILALIPDEDLVYTLEGIVAGASGPVAASSITLKRVAIVGGTLDEDITVVIVSTTLAGTDGRFTLTYKTPVPNPDLVVRATLVPSGTAELRVTRAEPTTFVQLLAAEGKVQRTIYGDLVRRIQDSGPAPTALEDEDDAAYDHLAARTGRSVVAVRQLANAAGLAADAGVTDGEEIFFALVDGEVEQTERSLTAQGIPALRRTVESAITAGHIRPFDEGQLDVRMGELVDRAVVLLRTSTAGTLSLGELMKTAPEVTDTMRDKISRRFVLHEGDAWSFWQAVIEDLRGDYPEGTDIEALLTPAIMSSAYGALAAFHKPFVEKIQSMRVATPALADPARIAALGPAAIDAAIDDVPLPQRAPEGMTVDAYKTLVKRALEVAYPTAWLEGSLSGDLKDFFTARPNFSFELGRLSNIDLSGVSEPLKGDLFRLERLHRLSSGAALTIKMFDEGFTSARSIVDKGKTEFVSLISNGGADTELATLADEAWEEASWKEFASSAAHSTYSSATNVGIASIPQMQPALAQAPDWETLFGTLDSCACAHCQSVYSPNAYFVDLLEFLSHQPDPQGNFPNLRERLFALRPDLQYLVLDCDTATTPLPQIDLVNEILELLVASAEPNTWPTTSVRTSSDADALAAAPEIKYPDQYVAAYNTLAAARYPFSTPFSLWDAQIAMMLEIMGVRRSRLIEVLGPSDAPTKERWTWLADLGVSLTLRDQLVTTRSDATDFTYWGFDAAEVPVNGTPTSFWVALADMRRFMSATQLTFEQVQELASVKWGGGALTIVPATECSLDALSIEGLTRERAWHLQRFLRLRAALGLSIDEMAKVGFALFFDGTSFVIDDARLIMLGGANAIAREWGISLTEALALFANMDFDSAVAPSLFRRTFLADGLHHDPPAALLRLDQGLSPINGLNALRATIASLLGVATEDLEMLINADRAFSELASYLDITGDAVSIENLSAFYRYALVAKHTKTSMRDVLALRSLAPSDSVFASVAACRSFVQSLQEIRDSAFSVDEVLYLLRHFLTPAAREAGQLGLSAEQIDRMNEAIEKGIAAATDESAAVVDVDGKTTHRLLHKLVLAAEAEIILAILEGSSTMTLVDKQGYLRAKLAPFLENTDEAQTTLTDGDGPETVPDDTLTARYTYLAKRLLRYDNARSFLVDWIATTFSIDSKAAAHLAESGALKTAANPFPPLPPPLETPPNDSPLDKTLLQAFLPAPGTSGPWTSAPWGSLITRTRLLHRLDKASLLMRKLELSTALLVRTNPGPDADPGGLPWLSFSRLSVFQPIQANPEENVAVARSLFSALRRLVALPGLAKRTPRGYEGLFTLFDGAASQPGVNAHAAATAFHYGWNPTDVLALITRYGWGTTSLRNELPYLRLEEAIAILRKVGASASEAFIWSSYDGTNPPNGAALVTPPVGSVAVILQGVTRAARSRYTRNTWAEVARPARDRLRQKQRDVLVAYLMAGEEDLESADAFFEAICLDVLVEPVLQTSRAVAATSTIQSFVQRGLLNGTSLNADGARDWKWLKAYRMWEAGRKIFLYPENYLEPELRTDRSPLFVELEQRLRQGALTYESAEAAYRGYLTGLAEVANLEIIAIYEEKREANEYSGTSRSERIVHAFGRTAPPHQLFHRMRRGGRWLAWERIGLEAQSNHFVVQSHAGRLYLIWLLSEQVASTPPLDEHANKAAPNMRLLCGLGYAIRNEDGTWGRPQMQPRDTWIEAGGETVDGLVLTAHTNQGGYLEVWLDRPLVPGGNGVFYTYPPQVTSFVLDPCSLVFRSQTKPGKIGGSYISLARNQLIVLPLELQLTLLDNRAVPLSLFRTTEQGGTLTLRHSDPASGVPRHVVFRDDHHSLFIEAHDTPADVPRFDGTIGNQKVIQTKFSIDVFSHAFVCDFQTQLANHGLVGLLDWSTQTREIMQLKSRALPYTRVEATNLDRPFPAEDVDFRGDGPYSIYNWELFFHIPIFIATRLMSEERYEEAQRWFHFVFDPTDGRAEQGLKRFWRVKPFYEQRDVATILDELETLADWSEEHIEVNTWFNVRPDAPSNATFLDQLARWRDDPFDPHAIARFRPGAYQKMVFIRYIENLLAWADQLFRRDTMETTNEATSLYLFAQRLLGPRPVVVDRHLTTAGKTYAQLDPDEFGNAIVAESLAPRRPSSFSPFRQRLPEVWRHLYFCVPANEALTGLWDQVEDRLFKLRNSLNIEGVQRTLSLLAPPIDPLLLARAAAAGIDPGALVGGVTQQGPYRFVTYLAKAIDLAQVVASYGQALLAALEKGEGEQLAILRSEQELALQQIIRETRNEQIRVAEAEIDAATEAKAPVLKRLAFYASVKKISEDEQSAIDATRRANRATAQAEGARLEASLVALYPSITIGLNGWAASPVSTFDLGGTFFAKVAESVASAHDMRARQASYEATNTSTTASHQRRWDEWKREEGALNEELKVIDKQIQAAEVRLAVAQAELAVVNRQIDHAKAMGEKVLAKFTNDELYAWMSGQLTILHGAAYGLAHEMARRAERAYQLELVDDTSFIRFDYLDSGHRGLLAGERLLDSLRALDAAYHLNNKRGLEITKHVALSEHAPEQLLLLRETGIAKIRLTEGDFDRDYPTHYLRRIKTASVSLQCATGPNEGVLASLTLERGEMRRTTSRSDPLDKSFTRVEGIVTSEGREDSGLFELNLRDERFLPFEGIGAHVENEDQWTFALTAGNQFDYRSISDLILHLRYTARNGAASSNPTVARQRLFSLRGDFTDAWEAFVEGTTPDIAFQLPKRMLPMRKGENMTKITKLSIFARWSDDEGDMTAWVQPATPSVPTPLSSPVPFGGLTRWDTGALTVSIADTNTYRVAPGNPETLVEAWIIVTYDV